MATIKTLVVKLVGDIAGFQQDMQRGASVVQQAGKNMQSAGAGITAGVSLPLLGAGGAALSFANDYNRGMANVASLGDEAAARVGEWKPLLQAMAFDVGKTTDDMSDGLYNVVSAFGAGEESLDQLEINARAASAGLASTTDAINLTSAVTKGYGDTSAAAVAKAADLALQTVALGQTTFPELASSVGKVVPLMANLGGTQEELFASMATLTGVTGGAAEVSTQLRGVLQGLMAPTADMTGLFGDLGFSSGQAMLEQLGLHGSIQAIVGASEASGTPLAKYLGSIEGQTAALALAGPQSDVYIEKLAAMGEASGAVDTAFAAQTEGVNAAGFAMQQAKIRATTLAQRMGDSLTPAVGVALTAVEPLVAMVERGVTWFGNLDPKVQLTAIAILALIAAIGPVLLIVGTMVSGIGTLAAVLSALALGPIAIVIAAVALLAAAWAGNWFGIRDKTAIAVDFIKGIIEQGLALITSFWATNGDAIVTRARSLWESVILLFQAGADFVAVRISALVEFVSGIWSNHGEQILAIVAILWDGLSTAFQIGVDILQGIIDLYTAALRGDWTQVGIELRGIVENLWLLIQNAFNTASDILLSIIGNLTGGIVTSWSDVDWVALGASVIDGIISGIANGIGRLKEAAINAARAAYEAAKGWLGFNSPAKRFIPMGEGSTQGLGVGMIRAIPATARRIKQGLSSMVGAIRIPELRVPDVGLPSLAPEGVTVDGLTTVVPGVQRMEIGLTVEDDTSDFGEWLKERFGDLIAEYMREQGREVDVKLRFGSG